MNKYKINSLIVALVLLVPCLAFALPGAHDPTSGKGYKCNTCHQAGQSAGHTDLKFASNVCYRCHGNGVFAGNKAKTRFLPEDFANPFGTTTVNQSTKTWSSHKWFGTDNVPRAGAQAPVDTAINGLNKSANFMGNLFCARCHNVHGTSGAQSNFSPYLRYPNDQDQMCLNCHAPRNTTNHRLGTHPVNITYTSASAKVKIASGTLLAEPVKNLANPTGEMKLIKGKVVCSTCHGVHYADSRSSTYDRYSAGQSFGQLSSSKGYLLRVDARGKTANALNICTNCHAGKVAHNYKGQNIQCNDCHSGHVEYEPTGTTEEKKPNQFLVRRYLQYSSATRISKRVFFRYTGETTVEYYNTTPGKYGICEGCHYPNSTTANHFLQSGDPNSGLNGSHLQKDCKGCHFHGATNGSFSFEAAVGSCNTACHGFPPKLATSGTDGEAGNGTTYTRFNESLTPHVAHAGKVVGTNYAFDCDQCHRGASMSNGNQFENGNYVEVFKTHTGASGINGGYIYAGKIASYTTASFACNNVYCHSNGKGAYKVGQKNILWSGAIGSIMGQPAATRCATCHSTATTFHNASTGHYRHVSSTAMNYGCQICHDNTVTASTTLRPEAMDLNGVHVNGVKDFVFNQGANPPAVGASCVTVACHSNGKGAAPVITPQWRVASTGACGACHKTKSIKTFGSLSSGGHSAAAHMTSDTHCSRCHTYTTEIATTHVDGTIQVNYPSCAVNGCHGAITAPTWTLTYTGKDTCTKCHGTLTNSGFITPAAENRYLAAPSDAGATDTGQVSTNAKIGAHQTHMRYFNGFTNYSTVDYYCQACHGTALMTYQGIHADGTATPQGNFRTLASNWGLRTPTYSGTTCSNTYCHNPAGTGGTLDVGDVGSDTAPDWNQPTYIVDGGKTDANCGKCHKVPSPSGFVKQSAHGSNTTVVGYDCSGCHGHNGDTGGLPGQRHMDGILYANGACGSCHGYPPLTATQLAARGGGEFIDAKVASYAGGGGYHALHLLTSIVEADAFTPCLPCHPSTSHQQGALGNRANIQVNAAADTSYRFDNSRSKRYNSTSWSCSNVSCHYRPTPAWNTAP